MEAYHAFPLPWWLRPLNEHESSGNNQDYSASILADFVLQRGRKKLKTIATLLKDKTESSCELPIDCRAQLNPFTHDNSDDEGLYDT